jgi:hypothetical protein
MLRRCLPWICLLLLSPVFAHEQREVRPGTETPADLIVLDARIYTAVDRAMAEAMAVRGDRLVYVGSEAGALAWRGAHTHLLRLHGRLVVPGLIDSHIHPIDILDWDVCDLDNQAKSLRQLVPFVQRCLRHYRLKPGDWLYVFQWNPSDANQPDDELPTLRAALDRAAPNNPVELLGSEGHQAAFNSRALALARDKSGAVIGYSRRTLATDFAALRPYIGLTAAGEPNGAVVDAGREPIDSVHLLYNDVMRTVKAPERMTERLNSVGITAFLDAMTAPEGLPVYDALLARQRMTVRANLAVYLDPDHFRGEDGRVDFDALIDKATAMRARYADNPFVRADFFKIFGDGEVEGDPFARPPRLGDAAMLHPYLEPIFAVDADHHATVTGYVDPDAAACRKVRADPASYEAESDIADFQKANGYFPVQCQIWYGKLTTDRAVLVELARRLHLAHFNIHVHVIGDGTARTIIDAIEAARAADGDSSTRDSIAHLQFADPDDVRRIGRDRLYVAFTYSWAIADLDYDMTIVPFVQKVSGNSYEQLHAPGSFYEDNSYPVRATRDAGGRLVAGSDAPVATRDPQPFVNMAIAVTRRTPGGRPMNAAQGISIRDVLDAYTIEGARFLGREAEIGSLESGKSADFVILDRDILALADTGHAQEVGGTRVLETWFRGERVYRRAAAH